MNALPLPTELEGITRDWLEAALRQRAPGVRLRGFAIVDVNHGTCTKVRLRLDHDSDAIPALVILKGGFEPHSRAMPYMHAEEVHGYADVAPHSPLRLPACHFAAFDPAAGQGIVIMDDLVARGVEFCHPQRPQAPDAVAKRLRVLARHHAMSWAADAASGDFAPGGRFDWATGYMAGFSHFATLLTPEVWASYCASARGAALSTRFHALNWMKDAIARMQRLDARLPQALLHGDTHLGNLYVDIDGEPGFFDTIPHRGNPMLEVAYHVTCALDPADRRVHDRALVAIYRDELAAAGVAPPSLDEMMHLFACFLPAGTCVFLLNASEFQPEAINTAYTARFSAAMLDHATLEALAGLP
ncbi:MAG: hypothetical protein KGM17_06580 [Sphingomonadales bacterium]|nr:hypothetical protein [Sphingomonadales bacterium]